MFHWFPFGFDHQSGIAPQTAVRDESDFFADVARLKAKVDRDRPDALRDDAGR